MSDELDDLFAGVFGDDASPDEAEPELAEPPPAAAPEQDAPPAVEQPAPEPKPTAEAASEDAVASMLDGFLGDSGLQTEDEKSAVDLTQPWMAHHHFVLVKTIEEVRQLVDRAIENGACGLDLETEGFDNRIDYDEQDRPYTRHKIVGYCISVRGVGHYIPVRHKFAADMGQSNPNVTPLEEVEAEITRLCLAAQPELTEEGKAEDPQGSPKIAVPPKVVIYFWHAKFDQEYLYPITGIDFWHWMSFECGNLASYCVYSDDKNLGLKAKSKQKLRLYPDKGEVYHEYKMISFKDLFPEGMHKSKMHFDELIPDPGSAPLMYACSDAICTELICEARKVEWDYAVEPDRVEYKEVLSPVTTDRRFKGTYRLEKQTVQAVRLMERTRMLIDMGEIDKLIEEAEAELLTIDEEFQGQAELKGFKGFNPGSPEQVGEFLFSERGLDINPKPEKTEEGQYKTDAGTLEKIADKTELEIIRLVIKRRQIVKIIGTYLKGMHKSIDENNRLRFNLKQTGAVTGRFTAPKGREDHGFAAIPIQGIPARDDPKKPKVAQSLRRLFISSLSYAFVKIDYSGQELRIVANLSKEPLWKKEFMEGSGDLHTLTAQAFFGAHITKADKLERNMAKSANFAMIYGGGVQAIMRATKCDKVEAARKKAAFDQSVPTFAKWVKRQHKSVKDKLGVFNGFGRFIRMPDAAIKVGDIDSNGKMVTDGGRVRMIRASCERNSTNYPVQGSGADILKIAMVQLTKFLTKKGWLKNGGDDSVRMMLTVHDEIVFEIKYERLQEALPLICHVMERPSTLARWEIPLVVDADVDLCWAAQHDGLGMLAGTKPIPEWLEGYITPGAPPPEMPEEPRPAPKPASPQAPAQPTAAPKADVAPTQEVSSSTTPQKPPEPRSNGATHVVTFRVHGNYLTRESIRLVQKAIAGARPLGPERGDARFKLLRLLDEEGDTLIGTELSIHIDPDQFARELRHRNMGKGSYTTHENL